MGEWNPNMYKAPRDGTHFLAWHGGCVLVGFYLPNKSHNAVRPETLHVFIQPHRYCAAGQWFQPTHWQLLLAPPQSGDEQ